MAQFCLERAGLGAGACNLIAVCALSPAEASGAALIGLAPGCTVLGSDGAGQGEKVGEKAGALGTGGASALGLRSREPCVILQRLPGRPPRGPVGLGADGEMRTLLGTALGTQ